MMWFFLYAMIKCLRAGSVTHSIEEVSTFVSYVM
jgi:hypothetical protein